MIITRQKRLEEILKRIGDGPVFLVGCSECATLCGTGGKDELAALSQALSARKIPVSGSLVLEPACHLLQSKRLLATVSQQLNQAQAILVMACGNGVQTVQELYPDKHVVGGTDALFVGEVVRAGVFEKRCTLCGDCLLEEFGGLCPVARCPKSMLNGPCGGITDGKCEVDPETPCVWDLIYRQLKEQHKLDCLRKLQSPKNWSNASERMVRRDRQ